MNGRVRLECGRAGGFWAKAKQKQKQKQSQSTCRHGFDLSTLRGSKKHADIKLHSLNLPLSDSFWCIFPSQKPPHFFLK